MKTENWIVVNNKSKSEPPKAHKAEAQVAPKLVAKKTHHADLWLCCGIAITVIAICVLKVL